MDEQQENTQSEKGTELSAEPETMSFAEFLETVPPSQIKNITDMAVHSPVVTRGDESFWQLAKPEIQLHCGSDACNGRRFFRLLDDNPLAIKPGVVKSLYMKYVCANCRKGIKTFALGVRLNEGAPHSGECYKYGELPIYGPPTPSRLISLVGPDRETFLRGRRCENQGLGLGALVYYRRVVENQKNRILDEIIKVSEKVGASTEVITALTNAKGETQFKRAIDTIKTALPQALLISGLNPLTLLHSALSEGIHNLTDERCLEIAADLRVVLGELSDRLGQALKDQAELKSAVSRLTRLKQDQELP